MIEYSVGEKNGIWGSQLVSTFTASQYRLLECITDVANTLIQQTLVRATPHSIGMMDQPNKPNALGLTKE